MTFTGLTAAMNSSTGAHNVIIDARTKPHHAPPLIPDPEVEKKIERFFVKGASLHAYFGLIQSEF